MEYQLIRSGRRSLGASIKDGKLVVRAPFRTPIHEIEAFLIKHMAWIERHLAKDRERREALRAVRSLSAEEIAALKKGAREVIPARVAHYAEEIGVTYGRVSIRLQKTRWGSCTARGDLSFNALLLLTPPEVLDAIVVHELCHRKHMDHSRRFYAEVLSVMPDYRARRKWLRENGDRLLAMAKREE